MASINQTILIRTDLFNLPEDTGLLTAQVAHIHADLFILGMGRKDNQLTFEPRENLKLECFKEWIKQPYIFVKKVPNAEALDHFSNLAASKGLYITEWRDTVYVRLSSTMKQAFSEVLVGVSFGPDDADLIRTVVGDLPLL